MTPQDITNILTFILGIATVWLAIETRRMSKSAEAQIALQSQPFLAFRGFDVAFIERTNLADGKSIVSLRFGLKLANPGQVLVSYNVERLTSSIEAISLNKDLYSTTGGVIHPNEESLFVLIPIQINSSSLSPATNFDFEISFWSIPQQKKTLKARVRFELLTANPLSWQHVFLEGPSYS